MSDTAAFTIYYLTLSLLGLAVWPIGRKVLSTFPDQGWIFSKTIGILLVSFSVWLLSILHLVRFMRTNVLLIAIFWGVIAWLWFIIELKKKPVSFSFSTLKLLLFQEGLFLILFGAWAYIRAHSPDIHGLEKFMDYGFVLSILRAEYFPPIDHFFATEPINYYYFGHLIAAVLSRLSTVPPEMSYNLQIATLFALSFMSSFSIGATFIIRSLNKKVISGTVLIGSTLSGMFTTVIGNLHAALNIMDYKTYWYATASRLIPFTINEFPVYSFVVADLHGHVSNIPHALLVIALLVQLVSRLSEIAEQSVVTLKRLLKETAISMPYIFLAFAIGASYATNAWDFPIYLILTGIITLYFCNKYVLPTATKWWTAMAASSLFVVPLFVLSVTLFLPYWLTVHPLSDGIGAVRTWSPIGLILILWGMYFFLSLSFIIFVFRQPLRRWLLGMLGANTAQETEPFPLNVYDQLALLFMEMSFFLIILPEIIYVRDIYTPDYYRANTMFKLYFAAWIIFSIATSYSFVRMITYIKSSRSKSRLWITNILLQYVLISATLLYPYLAINSGTSEFKEYKGLDGAAYLTRHYPTDAAAIQWLKDTIEGQPVILEAVGDSYTDYARISAHTGLPTVLGWPVHEWLWRGSYSDPVQPPSRVLKEYGTDSVAQRVDDVQTIYTSEDPQEVSSLLIKYNVNYIYVGKLEREKYPEINEPLLLTMGNIVFSDQSNYILRLDK